MFISNILFTRRKTSICGEVVTKGFPPTATERTWDIQKYRTSPPRRWGCGLYRGLIGVGWVARDANSYRRTSRLGLNTTFPGELEEYEAKRITRSIACNAVSLCRRVCTSPPWEWCRTLTKKIDREKNRDNTHAVLSMDFTRCMAIFACYLHCPQRFCQKVNPPCADRTTAKKSVSQWL
jgi:hypothetical protein